MWSTAACRHTCRAKRRCTALGTSAAHHDAAGQPCGCTACSGRLRQIGQDVSEQLDCVPARFTVIRHVQPKLACMRCQYIFQASAAGWPTARGLTAAGLPAHVLVSKYCDDLPLYQQSGITRGAVCSPTAPPWPAGSITASGCLTRWLPRWAATR
jgi:transposase